ncbi:Rpn family recombination-promoting nuclease/putative transposase [Oceanobacillus sp. CFH 90083]|uniref:Rpn family recombination-promoting nuclease/putative transposase n=1 Tax=Oceanobacillus sp. CFH 90083 TaxID=2592336 RepID=UPI00128E9477|nr:Rpn family recombination-promoting nuclease/putative transposase [Oceanobacillus sp. CFH 90083]
MIYPQKAMLLYPQIREGGEVYKNAIPKKTSYRLMDLKIDYAFRSLFVDERNKNITIAFLNTFFIKSKRALIRDFEFLNWEAAEDEKSYLRLLVETEKKESIYTEILFPSQDATEKQSFYFGSKLYRQQFEANSGFSENHAVIAINILNFEMSPENDEFHSVFRLADKEEKMPLTNLLEFQYVEIPKLIRSYKEGRLNSEEKEAARWLLLLAAVDDRRNYFYLDMYRELEKMAMTDKDLDIAINAWGEMSNTKENQLAYKDRHKQIIEQQFFKEIEWIEEKRKAAEDRAEFVEQKYNQMKKQYEQQKKVIAEEKQKRLEAEKNAVYANREAAKIVIHYGKAVARNLFKQEMSSSYIKKITGMSAKEIAMLKEELEEK